MASKSDHDIVYVAVPMTDEAALPSAPAIFVPSNARDVPSNNASRSFVKAAVALSLGFVVCTFLFLMAPPMHGTFHHLHLPAPCHHHLRGSPSMNHHKGGMHHPGMGHHKHDLKHHEHPGKHLIMHDMMHIEHTHGVEHHDIGHDVASLNTNQHHETGKRWKNVHEKNVHESSSSSEDGWYAGNASHDGWHVSMVDGVNSSSSYDNSSADDIEASFDENPLEMVIERVEMEKEDGVIPGLP